MHAKIIQAFEQIALLSEAEKESFHKIISQKQLKKGEFWLQEDKMNLHIAFLESGYLRKYYVKEGNEITIKKTDF